MKLNWSAKVILLGIAPVLIAAGLFFLLELNQVRDITLARIEADLRSSVVMLAGQAEGRLGDPDLQQRIQRLGERIGDRYTIIGDDGRVLADSDVERVEEMENHGTRPEVLAALAEGVVLERRYSRTLKRDLLYAAARIPGTRAVARVAHDVTGLRAELASASSHLWWVATFVVVLGVVGAYLFGRALVRPVKELTAAAEAAEGGDLSASVTPVGSDDVARLGDAFNRMTARLKENLERAEEETARLATILEGMSEGVLALEGDDRISFVNRRARSILGIGPDETVEGRGLYELVRDPRLLGLLRSVGSSHIPVEGEVTLEGPPRRNIQIHGARIADRESDKIVVLRDLSRIRRLERMRSDFVSNVSHELRTPLATIAAAVETLEDDEARGDAETGPRFVAMIQRNVSRLEALLDDILALSRMESRPESIRKVPLDFGGVVRLAADELAQRARSSGVEVQMDVGDGIRVLGDAEALRRIVDNLLLNAITYTQEGGHVRIGLESAAGFAVLSVADDGIGIPSSDIDRIFERFYRVDKARSRSVGGTGLGLAIVKHAVGLHAGSIEVESTSGEGSRFLVRIPDVEDSGIIGNHSQAESGTAKR